MGSSRLGWRGGGELKSLNKLYEARRTVQSTVERPTTNSLSTHTKYMTILEGNLQHVVQNKQINDIPMGIKQISAGF